ncbi:MAG: amino acid ABC transporter permease [Eubacteriales bacterium]|jgi:polar amino acid transport system permease protein|nr:amino acid ABC transporter permease [Eubacteriales bacterium]MDD3197697.1 amino acid ABC transporter permease [Eubacteriales bacterium]MDD3503587.1 amino acid ABC transporter permease [Eubacteriales bacterium]MDD4682590.1 amino acid ABC transporter permease [Eubacteriales bacterium]
MTLDRFLDYFQTFIPAAWMTLRITFFGILFGVLLGIIFALFRISKYKFLTWPAKLYIGVIRGTPLLLQLMLIYFGLVNIVMIDRIPSAIIALGIHNGAYIAEIFRGAIQSIDRGQKEAGISLGMTGFQVMKRIILPQAFKRAIPPLSNQFIIALKDSSLASAVGVKELLLHSRQLASSNYLMMEMLSIAAIYYLVMTSILTFFSNRIEKKLRVSDHRA